MVAIRTIVAASTMADTRASATMPGSSGGDLAGAKLPRGGNIDSREIPLKLPAKVWDIGEYAIQGGCSGSEGTGSHWFHGAIPSPTSCRPGFHARQGGKCDGPFWPHSADLGDAAKSAAIRVAPVRGEWA